MVTPAVTGSISREATTQPYNIFREATRGEYAAVSSTDTWSQTKYYLSDLSPQLTIIRRHHPLEGQKVDVLRVDKTWVVVRLPDGSSAKVPRRWTNADGDSCPDLVGHAQLCLAGLRELLSLCKALRARQCFTGDKIESPLPGKGETDVQATVSGVLRAGTLGGALEAISRASETRGDATVCALDGARVDRADPGAANEAGDGR